MGRKILYVGGFELPDRNAAAQRVIGNAKALRAIGYDVFFLNYSDASVVGWTEYEEFRCYQMPKRSIAEQLSSIRDVVALIGECQITDVFAYNYPALTLFKLIAFCRKNGLKCFADVTEWYVAEGNLFFRIIKNADTWWRMKHLHFQVDGVVAISEYLYQFYKNRVQTVKIPPLTDSATYVANTKKSNDKTVFLYAGSPSAQKERLDIIIDSIQTVEEQGDLELWIVGVTKDQYEQLYQKKCAAPNILFLGKLEHQTVLERVKNADWSIIIRDNNLVVKAGFPTKVTESISCGTPVIANNFSNITDYLNESNSLICEQQTLSTAIANAKRSRIQVDNHIFDYSRFQEEFQRLLSGEERDGKEMGYEKY